MANKQFESMSRRAIVDFYANKDCGRCPVFDSCKVYVDHNDECCTESKTKWLLSPSKTAVFSSFPNLRAVMDQDGVTTRQLAQEIGESENTLYPKIAGRADFKLWETRAIADFFGASMDWLFAKEK